VNRQSTRREFLKRSGAVAGMAAATPYIWTSETARAQDANSKLTVASIGVGGPRQRYGRGGGIARSAAGLGQTIAVCDCDQLNADDFNTKQGGNLSVYTDYRKMFEKETPDLVTIGTPDHTHVPIAIAALKAGSHVYCEKPLTLTIDEGKQVCKVVKETGKIFQVGTQQRTENNRDFAKAIAIVRSGLLGDNVRADVAIGGAPGGGPFDAQPIPEGLDWDLWLGPAPERAYSESRRLQFRWFLEYSGGKMTDWGAHHIDIAQWAISPEASPIEINGKGDFQEGVEPGDYDPVAFFAGEAPLPDVFNAALAFNIDFKYGNGAEMSVNNTFENEDGSVHFGNGILFTGSKGRIFVTRGKLSGAPIESMTDADWDKINAAVNTELYRGQAVEGHMKNFFECIESGADPISDVYSHHRTMTSCHMCNIALLLDRELKYDAVKEEFIDDDQANALMSRPQRAGHETIV
jgi:myo-inositol 2-dehydrogenase / D-chiro-inositol 1-dehydrogenase